VIVVDTNVVAYLLIEGEKTAQARALWKRDRDWCAPSLWRHEFLNILATLVKVEGLPRAQASALWTNAVELLAGGERALEMMEALRLAGQRGISAYDAQFVALAQRLGVFLVTEDRRLREACPEATRSLSAVLA
jgi:predicted nucleic acid-binding protein